MKNITLSADEHLIEQARKTAREQRTTLNAAFREWLEKYTSREGDVAEHDRLIANLRGRVIPGRKFTREEMNER